MVDPAFVASAPVLDAYDATQEALTRLQLEGTVYKLDVTSDDLFMSINGSDWPLVSFELGEPT